MISFLGIAAIIAIAILFSTNPRAIRPRIVLSAFALQASVAVLVLYVPAGKAAVETLSIGVQALLGFSSAGINMVFGPLASIDNIGFSFAVHVLPIVIFFSALMSVLYHLGVMQWIVRGVGGLIRRLLGTESVESLNAAANMFVGQTESPLMVRPYLSRLTEPQLFAIMVSGLASVAGTVLAAYAQMGIRIDYLLAASIMAAPGGLLMAKLLMPDEPAAAGEPRIVPVLEVAEQKEVNVILAAANGARDGLKLAVNIGAMLLAFVALIALVNGVLGGLGGVAGIEQLTMQSILGFIFAPIMFLLSVPWAEAQIAGALFGEKLILNEFVAYLHLAEIAGELSPRTEAVVTFALCGFANISSIAILLGGLGTLIPDKRDLIARFGLRAVAAASLSNLMSAALASLLIGL